MTHRNNTNSKYHIKIELDYKFFQIKSGITIVTNMDLNYNSQHRIAQTLYRPLLQLGSESVFSEDESLIL